MKKYLSSILFLLFAFLVNAQTYEESAGYNLQLSVDNQNHFGYIRYKRPNDTRKPVVIIPYLYDLANHFDDNANALVQVKGKYGLIDTLGKIIVPIIYDYVYPFSNGQAIVYNNGKFGAVNLKGVLVTPVEYDYINPFTTGDNAAALKAKNWGVISNRNSVILPFQYVYAYTNADGYIKAVTKTWDFFYPTGAPVTDKSYLAFAKVGNGYTKGYISGGGSTLFNAKGEKVLPADLELAEFNETGKLCTVTKKDLYGLYDLALNKLIIAPEYEEINFHGDILGICQSSDKDQYFLADLKGNKLAGKEFQLIGDYNKRTGFTVVLQNKKWGLVDKKGNMILPCEMGYTDERHGISIDERAKRISSRKGNCWGMTDFQGKIILPYQFKIKGARTDVNIFYFSGDAGQLIAVVDDISGKHGVVNDKGEWVLPLGFNNYDDIGLPIDREGGIYAPVAKDGKYGVYDLTHRTEVLPLKFGFLMASMEWSHARFYDDARKRWRIVVYKTQKVYASDQYDITGYDATHQWLYVENDNLKGVLNLDQKTIIPLMYDDLIYDEESGYFRISKNGMCGFVDKQNNPVIPLVFDKYFANRHTTTGTFMYGYSNLIKNGKSVLVDFKGKKVLSASDFNDPNETYLFNTRLYGNKFYFEGKYNENDAEKFKIIINNNLYDDFHGDGNIGKSSLFSNKNIIEFQEGLLPARKGGAYGYLDQNGNEAIPFIYQRVSEFNNGIAYVKLNDKYFVINRNGQKMDYIDLYLDAMRQGKYKY